LSPWWHTASWLWDALLLLEGRRDPDELDTPLPTELWVEAFEDAGLTNVASKGHLGPVSGQAGGITLALEVREGAQVLSVTGLELEDRDFSLSIEDVISGAMKRLGARELLTGDSAIDRTFLVRGDSRLVHALLDAETRRELLGLFLGAAAPTGSAASALLLEDVSLREGRLEATVPPVAGRARRAALVRTVLSVIRRLSRPADPAHGLALNALRDPLSEVRLVNLMVLAREYPRRPATLEALRTALADPACEIRLRAALELGEEGLATLRKIASDGSAPQGIQAEAIRGLGARLPTPSVLATLDEARRARKHRVAAACLASLGQRGGADVVEPLARVLAVERGQLAAAAAQALGTSGDVSAEAPLALALDRDDEGVGITAAGALGRVGTAVVIPRLHDVGSGSEDDALRRAAREAVTRIQGRLTDASPGQLSLAGDESGQLSLAGDESGRLGLTEDERGRVAPLDDEGSPGQGGPDQ
jgi:HEAT repeat protein